MSLGKFIFKFNSFPGKIALMGFRIFFHLSLKIKLREYSTPLGRGFERVKFSFKNQQEFSFSPPLVIKRIR